MTTIANELVQGDTLSFTTSVPDYLPSAGYTLTYSIRGVANLDLVASPVGTNYQITATSTQTETLPPGKYWWVAYITGNGQRFTVDKGILNVKPDLINLPAGYDGRTPAAIALAQAESALASFQAGGVTKSYTIGDRTMVYQDASQLLAVISYWRARVVKEETADKIANGLGNPRKLHVRFV